MATTPTSKAQQRRVWISSYLGTTIEYYDFLLYGSAAALVFGPVFFSQLSPLLGTIVALATLAAGYVARFAGAVIFGHYGDRLGRKKVMLVTMVTMGLCSGFIGLIPSYAAIGVAAPLLLVILRLIQGLAVGGEYGGAVLMASEHAGARRRGLAASAATMGAPSGAVIATGAMTLVATMDREALLSWGWRIPFLASFLLLALGLWFRARIEESPVFLADVARETAPVRRRSPIVEILRNHGGTVTKAVVVQLASHTGQGVFGVFLVSYAPALGYAPPLVLLTIMIGTLGSVFTTPIYAALSDRIGRKAVLIFGTVANGLVAYPLFLLIDSGVTAVFMVSVIVYLCFFMTPVTSVSAVMLSELFPTEVRYTGVSASYQLAQTVGSGLGPLIAASLLAAAGGADPTLIAVYIGVLAIISLTVLLRMKETAGTSLRGSTAESTPGVDSAQPPVDA